MPVIVKTFTVNSRSKADFYFTHVETETIQGVFDSTRDRADHKTA